jgi:hypothetical protein
MEEKQNTFSKLFDINVNDYTETKKSGSTELTYLSWAWAWATFKKECPNADYEIVHWEGKPYLYDEDLGYMVETRMTDGIEWKTMWLPVMNGANKAMKNKQYTYTVKNWQTKQPEEKVVEPATMFDINTAIMRCLVKNIGMFGLGLYIYAGEDLPDGETVKQGSKAKKDTKPSVEEICAGIQEKMTLDNWKGFYAKAMGHYGKDTEEYKIWSEVFNIKKKELEEKQVKDNLAEDAEFLKNI